MRVLLETRGAISASSSADGAAHGASMAVDGSSSTFWVSVLVLLVGRWRAFMRSFCRQAPLTLQVQACP